jgi:hypothetical protein
MTDSATLTGSPHGGYRCASQEFGGNVIWVGGLVVTAGAESVEWYQIHQTHGFYVLDAIPFALFQPLL